MNKTIEEALDLVKALKPVIADAKAEVVVCPTSVCLFEVVKELKGSNIGVGAQNMHYKDSGAYTGEISPVSIKDLGAQYVILGHSERRQYFKETDEEINKKVAAAINHGILPILCIGETLSERETGVTFDVIKTQFEGCLAGFEPSQLKSLIIAYEPVWAIGTGKTATKEDANEVIGFIRVLLDKKFGLTTADNTRILYGGSVKASNIKELMDMPEIDGALVGGASLELKEFTAIVNY